MAKTSTNLFDNAKTVVDDTPKKKGAKEEVFISDLDKYAALDAIEKSFKGMKEQLYGSSIDKKILDYFTEKTVLSTTKPENFKGIGLKSEASCELRKRSSKSPLKTEEIVAFKRLGVRTETLTLTPAKEESFQLGTALTDAINKDSKRAQAFSQFLLKTFPEISIDELVYKVAAKDAETVEIVSDDTFSDIAQLTKSEQIREAYEIAGTPAVKPKMLTNDLAEIWKIIESTGISVGSGNDDSKGSKKSKK